MKIINTNPISTEDSIYHYDNNTIMLGTYRWSQPEIKQYVWKCTVDRTGWTTTQYRWWNVDVVVIMGSTDVTIEIQIYNRYN